MKFAWKIKLFNIKEIKMTFKNKSLSQKFSKFNSSDIKIKKFQIFIKIKFKK